MSFAHSVLKKYKVVGVHYSDLYPKGFEAFRKKYLKLSKTWQGKELYVQFTNHLDNTMDKKAWENPDHKDPVGVYGYPLSYVCSHPADVWYGAKANYLRILKDVSTRKLYLPSIQTEDDAINVLNLMGFGVSEARNLMKLAWKHYKYRIGTSKTKYAKMMMAAIQMDLTKPEQDASYPKKVNHPIRSGKEQTELFKKAGYDSLEDDSKTNNQAIINDREPQQVIFLSRGAFKVVDIFNLRLKDTKDVITTNDPDDASRKLAAQISSIMKDTLTSDKGETTSLNGWTYFWTKKGRRIEIDFPRNSSYYKDKKMGEKKHKEDKLSTPHATHVVIQSEIGEIKRSYLSDEKFKDILDDIRRAWLSLVKEPADTSWKPQDKSGYHMQVAKEKMEYYRKQKEKEKQEALDDIDNWSTKIADIASLVGKPWQPTSDKEELLKAYEYTQKLFNLYKNTVSKSPLSKEDQSEILEAAHFRLKGKDKTPEMSQVENILFSAWSELRSKATSEYWLARELREQREAVAV